MKKITRKLLGDRNRSKREYDLNHLTYLESSFINSDLNSFLHVNPHLIEQEFKSDLISAADRILNHQFKILYPDFIKVAATESTAFQNTRNEEYSQTFSSKIQGDYEPLDWHSDFYRQHTWDKNTWHKDIRYGNIEGVDVKIPWEFGRMKHLPILALAYSVSNDDKYLREWQNQIYDFYTQNPPRFGVQWSSTMDVAIRAVNMLVSFDILNQSNTLSESFKNDFANIIFNHGHHIFNNLEWNDGLRGNHYLANLCGLIFISAYLPESDETKKWLDFASKELENEIEYQFNDDGSNFEASIPYHNLSTQFVLHSAAILKSIGREIKYEKIQKIIEFSISTTSESSILPQIGDNDSGYLFSFDSNFNPLSISWMNEFIEQGSFLVTYKQKLKYDVKAVNKFTIFEDFGLAIYSKERYEALIRCGDIGQNGKGGHTHNDQLSFVLRVDGEEVITDPGTYLYTSSAKYRNKFRSTEYHNTLCINGHEQNEWFEDSVDDLFWLKDNAQAMIIDADDNVFKGKHSGFAKDHIRTVNLNENGIELIDNCNMADDKFISFHFHPSCEAIIEIDKVIVVTRSSKIYMKFDIGDIKLEEYDYSSSYGIIEKAKRIKVHFTGNEIRTSIEIK